jgi:hypothetical protein
MEDDAKAVAKMLKNSISTLTKEREERKHIEREVDGVAGVLIPNVALLGNGGFGSCICSGIPNYLQAAANFFRNS